MRIYHGSDHIIEFPKYGLGSVRNDYGKGFYCTEHIELAKEWACGSGNDGYANEYDLDAEGLVQIDLNSGEYSILNWLAVLTKNRTYWERSAISEQAKIYLQEHFSVDLSGADVVRGYRADDSYFSFAQDFVANAISLRKLKEAMHLGDLGEQIVLISPQAFGRIRFVEAHPAYGEEYYQKKKERDLSARRAYRNMKRQETVDDLFMLDIMRGGIANGDARL